jgi:dethiobiotin synthetase
MSKGIFVTATDTGVGKTVVAASIIRALRRSGIMAGAMKPIETGLVRESGILLPADGFFLREAAGMDDSLDLVTPVRFSPPLAPYMASRKDGMPFDLDSIFNAYERLSRRYEFMVVEGVGGVMVPLAGRAGGYSRDYYVIDLIRDLNLDAVVVARSLLGTINHTLLSVSRLLDEGISVLGVIISCSTPPQGSIAEETNLQALRELCPAPVIGVLPYLDRISIEEIDANTAGCIDIEALKR